MPRPDCKIHLLHLSGSSSRHVIQTESSLAAADGSHPDGSAGCLNTRTDVPRRQYMLKFLRREQKLLPLLLQIIILLILYFLSCTINTNTTTTTTTTSTTTTTTTTAGIRATAQHVFHDLCFWYYIMKLDNICES